MRVRVKTKKKLQRKYGGKYFKRSVIFVYLIYLLYNFVTKKIQQHKDYPVLVNRIVGNILSADDIWKLPYRYIDNDNKNAMIYRTVNDDEVMYDVYINIDSYGGINSNNINKFANDLRKNLLINEARNPNYTYCIKEIITADDVPEDAQYKPDDPVAPIDLK